MTSNMIKPVLLLAIAFGMAGFALAMDRTETEPRNEPETPVATPTTSNEPAPAPHCQVPCGVYTDQMRFEQMLEDTKTIAKAIAAVNEFADSLNDGPPSAKGMNQVTRWISTKDDHATNTQKIVAEYFLTQRIKESNKEYSNQLITAHKVMVAAMKCKQDANPATAETLKKAILDLYRAYEGKEPKFEEHK